jgi:hypothetical protein
MRLLLVVVLENPSLGRHVDGPKLIARSEVTRGTAVGAADSLHM